LQDLVVRHQRELAEREAALSHARDELVSLRTSIANSNAERDIALASEARLSTALKEAVQERDRQMRLAEKLRTFESEVTARETAERAERAEERATLQREWMSARQLLEEERVLSQQRTQQHSADLKESARKCDELSQDLAKAKMDVLASQAEASSLRAQTSSLSEQLSSLHSRLEGRLSQLGARGDVDVSRLSQLELTVTSLESELASAKTALESKERHAAEYKAIAEAAEDSARIMRESQGKAIAAVQAETSKALSELSAAKAAANAAAETLDKVRAEAVAASGEWFKTEDSLKSQILMLTNELKSANEKSVLSSQHEAQLVADMKRLDEARERAQANYDLQLQMHAADGRTLKELQEKSRSLEDSAIKARDEAARSQAALITAQQLWVAKEASLTSVQSELKNSLTTLKDQNALLHSSLTALGAELDKLRTATPAEALSSSSSSSEEVEALRVSSSQLREVVAYLRRQNEVLEGKKDLAEQRLQNAEEIAEQKQKMLDEVRAYGKRLQDQLSAIQSAPIEGSIMSSVSSPGGGSLSVGGGLSVRVLTLDEHQRLLEKVSQVALLFESNKLLREENERAAASKQEAEKRSAELAATVGPLQAAQRAFSSEKQAWESERAMLKEESALWKTRLEGVFAARDAVDPAVHRALAEQLEALQSKSAEQVAKLSKAISRADEAQRLADEYKSLADAKSTELAAKIVEMEALMKDLEAKTKDVEAKTKDIETLESSKTQMRTATISWKKKYEEASQKLKELAPTLQSPAGSSSSSTSAATAAVPSTADNAAAIAAAVAAAKESLAAQHLAAMKAQKDEYVKQLDAAKLAVTAAQQALAEAQTRFDAEKSRIETHLTSELSAVRSSLVESEAKTKKAGEAYTKVKTVYDKLVADLKKKKFEEEAAAASAAIQSQSANAAATAFAAATSILPSSSSAAKFVQSSESSSSSNSAATTTSNNVIMSSADSFAANTVSPQLPFRSIGGATEQVLTFGVAPKLPVVAAATPNSNDSVLQKAFIPAFPSSTSPSGTSAPVFGSASSTLSFGTSSNQMFAIGSMATTTSSSSISALSVSPGGSSAPSLNPLATPFLPTNAPTTLDNVTAATPAAAPAAVLPADVPAPQSARKQKPQKSTKKSDSLQSLPSEVVPPPQSVAKAVTKEVASTKTSVTPSADELLKRRAARFAAATLSDNATAAAGATAVGGGDNLNLEGASSASVSASGQRVVRTKRKLEEPVQSIATPASVPVPPSQDMVDENSDSTRRPNQSTESTLTSGVQDAQLSTESHAVTSTLYVEAGASSRKIARRDAPSSPVRAIDENSAIEEDFSTGNEVGVGTHETMRVEDAEVKEVHPEAELGKDEGESASATAAATAIHVDEANNEDDKDDGIDAKGSNLNNAVEILEEKHSTAPVHDRDNDDAEKEEEEEGDVDDDNDDDKEEDEHVEDD
jgi:hypothetical protein